MSEITEGEQAAYIKKHATQLEMVQNDLQGIIHHLAEIVTLSALHDDNDTVGRLSRKVGELSDIAEALR